jgi:hypothetical protein
MKIEVGKTYENRIGAVIGPMSKRYAGIFAATESHPYALLRYNEDGTVLPSDRFYFSGPISEYDLVKEITK